MTQPQRDNWWREIPNAIIEQDQRQTAANDWATQRQSALADEWAGAQYIQLAQDYPQFADMLPPASYSPPPPAAPVAAAPAQQWPAPDAPVTASLSQPQFTPTTAEISGAKPGSGRVGPREQAIMSAGADIASWLGDQGQRALQSVLITEGGMGGAVGDTDRSSVGSHGPLQFYGGGGQLNNFAAQHNMSVAAAARYVKDNPVEAIQWAIGTPDKPGYLGAAIAAGQRAGLSGPALAEYAQRHGQVSESPERAAANYRALFSGGEPVVTGGAVLSPGLPSDVTAGPRPDSGFMGLVQQAQQAVSDHVGGAASAVTGAVQQAGPKFEDLVSQARNAVGYVPEQPQQPTPGFGYDPSSMRQSTPPADTSIPLRQDVRDLNQPQQPTIGDALGEFGTGTGAVGQYSPTTLIDKGMKGLGQVVKPAAEFVAPYLTTDQAPPDYTKLTKDQLVNEAFSVGGMANPMNVKGASSAASRVARLSSRDIAESLDRTGTHPLQTDFLYTVQGGYAGGGVQPTRGVKLNTEPVVWMTADGPQGGRTGVALAIDKSMLDPSLLDTHSTSYPVYHGVIPDAAVINLGPVGPGNDIRGASGLLARFKAAAGEGGGGVRAFIADESGALGFPKAKPTVFDAAVNVPANQKTAEMLDAKPPKASDDVWVNKVVRAWTNRNEAADRFQEEMLRGAGMESQIPNPPQALDLAARIRQFATDGAVKVAEDSVLKPAVQAVGGGEAGRKVLSSVLVHQNNVDIASATGNTYRKFPGGGSLIQSQTALQQIEQQLGPAEWARVQAGAQQVYGLVKDMRQRMLDSGLIDRQEFNMWNGQMPHWVPTRILDYLDEAKGPQIGSKISLSNNGVRHYSEEGTAKFQEDPLASILGVVAQVERNARKNEAVNALLELDKLSGKPLLTKTDAPVTNGGTVVQYIRNGTVERYVAPPQLAAVINGPQITQAPGFVRDWTNFQRAVTTILSPAFALVRNPALDIPETLLRETSRAGGNPLAIPHIVSEMAKGYADSFQGLLQGEFRGPGTRQYLAGGGSGSTMVSTFEGRKSTVESLSRGNPLEIKSAGDVMRLIKNVLTPVAKVAERTELGPRVAAMRLAEQRGATPLRATMAGRTVTMDFNEGGTLAKVINQYIPFFNAGVQGTAIPIRMFRENPAGALASSAMMVGLPAVVAEAWNNSDPQRARDYQDVPQYLKQGGVVIMLPGEAQTDPQGNRKPQFLWINMRGMAPFASIAREAATNTLKVAGNGNVTPEAWQQLLTDVIVGSSPIRANSIGDVPGAITPNILGASTGLQLVANHDFFRNRDIATKRNDESASALSKGIADNLTRVAQTINPKAELRPSQVEFAVKDLLGGVGSTILAASDVAKPKDSTTQNTPVLGGVARAAGIRNDTGETFRSARDQGLSNEATAWLNSQNVKYMPGPVSSEINGIPLRMAEETRYQELFNKYASELILREKNSSDWATHNPTWQENRIKQLVEGARNRAELEVLRTLPDEEKLRRFKAKSAAP